MVQVKKDARAITRAAKGLAPMLARRTSGLVGFHVRGANGERMVRAMILERLVAVEDDDLQPAHEDELLWCRVERSGLVLVGVGERAYIVARTQATGGRALRLLVR